MNLDRVILSLAALGLLAVALITARSIYWEHKVSKKTAVTFLLSATSCIVLLLVLFLFL